MRSGSRVISQQRVLHSVLLVKTAFLRGSALGNTSVRDMSSTKTRRQTLIGEVYTYKRSKKVC